MLLLQILSFIIMAVGFATVYAAKFIVKKYGLVEKQKCDFASEMTEEEVYNYKYNKAVYSIKIKGLLISIPGLILFFFNFR